MRRLSLRNQRPRLRLGVTTSGLLVAGGSTYTPATEFDTYGGSWWDFTDLSTLFQDVAGTTPATTPGQTVALAQDKSGNGNDLTQGVAGNRPTLRQNGSGVYYLEFDGSSDYLSCASTNFTFLHDGTGAHIAMAGNVRSVAGTTYVMASQAFTTAGRGLIIYSTTTAKLGVYSANGVDAVLSADSGDNSYAAGTNAAMSFMYVTSGGGTDFAFRKNGASVATVEDSAVPSGSAATDNLYIGASTGASAHGPLDLYQICMVARPTLSTDLETYMQGVWG